MNYSESQLAEIKRSAIAFPVYAASVRLEKNGKDFVGCCPFSDHADKSPSFTITDRDGALVFKCFGCNRGGDIIKFVQELHSVSFGDAIEKIKGIANWNWKEGSQKVSQVFQPLAAAQKKFETFDVSDLAPAERNLELNAEARMWLAGRGITLETAKKFHLGFVQSAAKVSPQHELVNKGWILFPTIEGDTITLLKYRSIVAKSFVRKANMETGLYNADAIQPFDDVFVVEGEMDVLTLAQAGYNAVGLPNASFNVTPELKDRLLQANRIFLAGDTDNPGQQAMTKLWTELRDRTYLLKWPDAKDANEYFLKGGDFKTKVEELKQRALEQPMPYMHDLAESMYHADSTSPFDNPARLRFPWPRIDNWTAIVPGDVMVVSATETGTGKTAWIMDILLENALKYGKTVVNYSAEVPPGQYARRAVACLTGANRDGLKRSDFELAASKMADAKFYNGYKPGANWKDVVELLKWAKRRLGADILVIDHLHFLTRSEKDETKAQSEAMRAFKDLAIEYGVIMIVVGQPRKPQDEHRGRELQTRGIKGSESMGSDASQVFILHRPRLTDDSDDMKVLSPETKVILDKSRESEGRITKLLFRGEICKFVEMREKEEM